MLLFNIDFEIISLMFLIIIAVRFFSRKQFPTLSNRFYGFLLVFGILNLSLDILGTLVLVDVKNMNTLFLPYFINSCYYVVELVFPSALLLYLYALKSRSYELKRGVYLRCCMVSAIAVVIFFIAAPMGKVFVVGWDGTYSYGAFSKITYICLAVYLVLTLVIIFINWKVYTSAEKFSIIFLVLVIIISSIIQFFFPRLLLSGTAISVSLAIMYFTIQDPQKMIDSDSGLFNNMALYNVLSANHSSRRKYHIVSVKIHALGNYFMLYGRKVGNSLVMRISGFLKNQPRSWAFRTSESRFVIVFSDEKDADRFLEDARKEKEKPILLDDIVFMPEITVCCVKNAEQLKDLEAAMKIVENAMSDFKVGAIKDKITVLDKYQLEQLSRDLEVENEIRESIVACENFQLYYQPIYCLRENRFCSAEVLLRYKSPTLGRLTPAEFIPIVEEKGLSIHLDEMVVKMAFEEIVDGHIRNLGFDNIHINLSAASFSSEVTTDRIFELARRYDIDPSFIVFEITETAASHSQQIMLKCVQRLREGGFGLALDDFGMGYGNITQALNLPFTNVKIDKTLVQSSNIIVKDVVNLFRNFNIRIIAEGVENEAQKEAVVSAGVDAIQGYLYSRAIPCDELDSFIKNYR